LLTAVDGDAFANLCQIHSRIVACNEFIKNENPSLVQESVMLDSVGQEHKRFSESPYVRMERTYYQLFRLYAQDFGLVPRGRAGIQVSIKKVKDEFFD